MITNTHGKATLEPAFVDVWNVPAFRGMAEWAYEQEADLYANSENAAAFVVRGAVALELIDGIKDQAAEQIAPSLAADLQVAMPPPPGSPSSDQALIEIMIARDMARFWIQSDWRAALSYRQLVQSRIWASAIAEPLLRPFTQYLCAVEEAIKAEAIAYIGVSLDYWLTAQVKEIAGALRTSGSKLKKRFREAVAMDAVGRELTEEVLRPIEDRYNKHPAIVLAMQRGR